MNLLQITSLPVSTVAVLWDGKEELAREIAGWALARGNHARVTRSHVEGVVTPILEVHTMNGWVYVEPGAFVVASAREVYPVSAEVFVDRWSIVEAAKQE